MSVRPARITDVALIRGIARQRAAHALADAPGTRPASATRLALLSSFQALGARCQTLVLPRDATSRGFVQAVARPGRESWDVAHLACIAPDVDTHLHSCGELLEGICLATAQRGALRTFIRLPSDGALLSLALARGFRAYASEITWSGSFAALIAAASLPDMDVRTRQPRDAWDIFSLYCAITPALVRHAEGRSLREWTVQPRGAASRLWAPACREIVLGNPGHLDAWIRWRMQRHPRVQVLDVLVRPPAAARLGEMLRLAAEVGDFDPACPTLCRTREYDGRVSATLEMAGFGALYHETLLVRHTVARVTERQLLIAALRAQGLGIDISHYHRSAEPARQRLSSCREAD
jgi:hypothetical protein